VDFAACELSKLRHDYQEYWREVVSLLQHTPWYKMIWAED
jgi:hypothetical protein